MPICPGSQQIYPIQESCHIVHVLFAQTGMLLTTLEQSVSVRHFISSPTQTSKGSDELQGRAVS